eukprot:TRINITY_DN74557_c0_g1_i1.p2 TRINITY_DN74557_c0_g1~~TRINITY_DN74557_c0_g1_i1.p2  ORF type:complete len:406 (-),score=133.72 TRINITY_DN74557_c0_g1_i1:139-1356(-)
MAAPPTPAKVTTPPWKLVRGKAKTMIEGCVASTTEMKNKEFDKQRIVILSYLEDKDRWAVRLYEARWKGKEILVKEENIRFDQYVAGTPTTLPSMLRVGDAGGAKEDGVYATRDIKEGEVVLEDPPIMVVSNKNDGFTARWNCYFWLESQLGKTSPMMREFLEITNGGLVEEYMSDCEQVFKKIILLSCGEEEWNRMHSDPKGLVFKQKEVKRIAEVITRWQANSHDFPALGGASPNDNSALFRWASKINHSCEPNCKWELDSGTGKMVVKALKDIPKGEELSCSYFGDGQEFMGLDIATRRKRIKAMRYFTCECPRCKREYEVQKAEIAAKVAKAKEEQGRSPEEEESKPKPAATASPKKGPKKEPAKTNGYASHSAEDAPKICEVTDEEAERILEEKRKRQGA